MTNLDLIRATLNYQARNIHRPKTFTVHPDDMAELINDFGPKMLFTGEETTICGMSWDVDHTMPRGQVRF